MVIRLLIDYTLPIYSYTHTHLSRWVKTEVLMKGTNNFWGVIGKMYENASPPLQSWPNYATLSRYYVKQILHIFHYTLQ